MPEAEHQSAPMSRFTNDGLTQSGTGCFIAVSISYGNSGHQTANGLGILHKLLHRTKQLRQRLFAVLCVTAIQYADTV